MKVAKDVVVSLAYQVRTEDGVLVDESPVSAPLDYLHGHGSLIVGLEKALEGHKAGDSFNVRVNADEGYGSYDENLVQRVPKGVFMGADELEVGMRFLADTDQGPVPVEITAVEDASDDAAEFAGGETLEVSSVIQFRLSQSAHTKIANRLIP